jgi:hypothetical protein
MTGIWELDKGYIKINGELVYAGGKFVEETIRKQAGSKISNDDLSEFTIELMEKLKANGTWDKVLRACRERGTENYLNDVLRAAKDSKFSEAFEEAACSIAD